MSRRIIIHPVAEATPALVGERLDAFVDAVKTFGPDYLEPVIAVPWPEPDGSINGTRAVISGRSTLEACKRLGLSATIREYGGGKSPVELAASIAALRPQLTIDQRAAVAVELADHLAIEAKQRQKAAGGDKKALPAKLQEALPDLKAGEAVEHAARKWGVSPRSVYTAKGIRAASPDLFQKLKTGDTKLGPALQEIRRGEKRKLLAGGAMMKALPSHLTPGSEILTGDALKILPAQPRRKFRLLCTDPPYNQGYDYGFGSKADQLPDPAYLDWTRRWMREGVELLTPDGAFVVIINSEYAADYANILKRELKLHLRAWIIWNETFGVSQQRNFQKNARHILYFTRSKTDYVFNEEIFHVQTARSAIYGDKRSNAKTSQPADMKICGDVWGADLCFSCGAEPPTYIPRLQGTSKERLPDGQTQLPEKLIRRIVAGFTEPGDRVCDPFSGSGTTAAVCAQLDRSYLAIELFPPRAEQSRARVAMIEQGKGGKR